MRSLWDMGLQLFQKHLSLASEVEHKIVFGLLKMIEGERGLPEANVMATSAAGSTVDALSNLKIDDWASTAPNLRKNLHILSPQQVELDIV
ncbi:hypothetical protein CASFOL_031466 [Castilleja foliolosa]|uniref:Uncharacterized protein n=1 Tax=Castilleja foliolosa TaxID=1961234 RepID=A0ABD3C5N6_9LAMI